MKTVIWRKYYKDITANIQKTKIMKKYEKPEMKVIEMDFQTALLCGSSNDNPYWNGCHEGWQGSWDDEEKE